MEGKNKMAGEIERQVVIPGEVIAKGNDYLPGEGTEKNGDEIIALRYGLSEESNKLIKVIALSGVYQPRRGNTVIGKVEGLTFNGWILNVGASENAFLPLSEVPRFVAKGELADVFDIGDLVMGKIVGVNGRGIDITVKARGLGRVDGGMIMEVNPNKVPRIIGKEGSMISLIKNETGCNITVGQNGFVWIQGKKVEDELFVRKAINFVSEKSYLQGLTEEVQKWFDKEKGGKKK
jgi:exosome complex component RRP4